jgi:hypothetical protein
MILEKFRGVFVKLWGSNYFLKFLIYFPIVKDVEYDHGMVDRIHGAGPWVHGPFIKP